MGLEIGFKFRFRFRFRVRVNIKARVNVVKVKRSVRVVMIGRLVVLWLREKFRGSI